ncbi:MAG: dephospho-CoA kinase [Caldisericaceae bacterium]
MKIIGLTGNIASGKSAISNILKELGANVIDMDRVGKEIQDTNYKNVVSIISATFGDTVIQDKKINRKLLATLVFTDTQQLAKLNEIMIPLMTEKLNDMLSQYRQKRAKIVVIDAAILFEAGWDEIADEIWVVYTSEETQLSRLMEREHIDESAALSRIRSQMGIGEKIKRADVVIDNSGSLDKVRREVRELWMRLDSI